MPRVVNMAGARRGEAAQAARAGATQAASTTHLPFSLEKGDPVAIRGEEDEVSDQNTIAPVHAWTRGVHGPRPSRASTCFAQVLYGRYLGMAGPSKVRVQWMYRNTDLSPPCPPGIGIRELCDAPWHQDLVPLPSILSKLSLFECVSRAERTPRLSL